MMKSPNRQNNIEAIYPLSPMQQGMLFHTIYYPTSGEYFEQLSCTLAGDLDMDAFIKAWQQAVNRHTILRTSFVWKKLDKMLQVVHRQVNVPYKILNWQHLSKKEQEAEFGKFLKQDRIKGFDLSKAPLVRFVSIRISESQYKFVMSHHHVLIDGWSLPILLKEVFTFYAAFHEGNDLKLSPARPYHDYINWLQRQDMTKAERFWRSYLKGFVAPTPIPLLRRTEDEVNRYQSYSKERITLPASDTQALQQLARENKITLSTVIQGAWALLLHKYTGEDDIIFGMTVSGRPAELPDVESMIGLFINTLPVRIKIRNNMPVWKWLKKLQADQIELRDYEFTPLVQIQGWSEISRNLPLFQSLVVFENYPLDSSLRVQVENLNFQDIKTYSRTNYPINLISAPEDEIPLILAYDSSRFERKAVRRMLAHLQILLSSFATQIDKPMIDLSVLTDEELDLLKKKWVGTQTDYGEGECISVIFEEQVLKTPDKIALSHGTHEMTYLELNRQANKLACYLRKTGVGPESIVGLYIDRSMEMIIGILAILKAGGAYLPLDPHYPRQRLEYMIEDSGSTILLTTQELKEIASGYQCKVVCLDLDASKLDSEDDNNPTANITSQNLAYIIYTSGSTGKPKGTMMEHHGIGNLIDNMRRDFRVSEESRHLQFASFSFDASIGEIFVTLLSGGTLVLADHETLMSTDDLFRLLNDQKITHVVMPPSLLAILPNAPLPYMKTVVSAGESCSREVARRWSKDYHFLNGYGPTETTVGCSWGILGQQSPEADSVPIGRAIDNVQIYLLDSYSNLVPPGVSGELCIGGAGLGRGYLNRPDLTAEKFIPNPFANTPGERLYRTGDLARYLPNGELEFEGRIDHQVKIRGFRVELGEIDLILRKHSQVKDVVITLSEDKQNSKVLLAFIITEEKEFLNINGLRDYCRQHLPEYMIPSSFIRLEKFPLLPNGKVDRKALPIPDGQISAGSDNYAAPRTPVEELLAGIWSDILQKNHIGVNDNFFDLGGHSLKMTQLSSRIRQIFQIEIPLRVLFESPTISKIAERIKISGNGRDTLSLPPIRRIPRDGELSLSFTQQRLWFLDQLVPDSNYYNINSAVRLQG
ncbi:MAG: amino acid adenylation domain-containing protein, partial [Calditrichia bacterium]